MTMIIIISIIVIVIVIVILIIIVMTCGRAPLSNETLLVFELCKLCKDEWFAAGKPKAETDSAGTDSLPLQSMHPLATMGFKRR
eukprot:6023036-Amphidinium_carterae.1